MKRVFVFLTVAILTVTSCSKDKEGCNDRRASNFDQNVIVDDVTDPTQWQLPAEYISAGGFKLIWASNDSAKGTNHANNK